MYKGVAYLFTTKELLNVKKRIKIVMRNNDNFDETGTSRKKLGINK